MTANPISELTVAECQQLLDGHHFGRLAFVDHMKAVPTIIPVNYLTHGGHVVFRTDPGAKLTAAMHGAAVAFEVDGIDEQQRVGWNVVVQGQAKKIDEATEIEELVQTPLVSWVSGAKQHFVRIVPGQLSGRRVSVADLPYNWLG